MIIHNYLKSLFYFGTIYGAVQSEKKMYYQNTWKDQLTRVEYYTNGTLNYYETMTYDNSGNIINLVDSRTSYLNKSYQWDGRQLTNYGSYCNSLTFKYNDQGIRTQKVQNVCGSSITTNYVLDGNKVLVETRSNGITIYYTYDVDGSLLSMNYNGTEYFYITNLQGDIIELRDMSGNVVVKYKYDAWGNIVYQFGGTLADINPYRYRGYRFDIETGFYYLQSRYYNPQIGRFISADVLVGKTGNLLSQNMYAYAGNNPVMNVDPSGYFWQSWDNHLNDFTNECNDIYQWVKGVVEYVVNQIYDNGLVIEIKLSLFGLITAGGSMVINFKEQYIEYYDTIGIGFGMSPASLSIGMLDNYSKPGDFRGEFLSISGTSPYYIGGGHSFTPDWNDLSGVPFYNENGARATYLQIGTPGVSMSYEYYLWHGKNKSFYYWGD